MPLVRNRPRGRAAHRDRVQLLRELAEAQLLEFLYSTAGPDGEYVVKVSGETRRVDARNVEAYAIGLVDGYRASGHALSERVQSLVAGLMPPAEDS